MNTSDVVALLAGLPAGAVIGWLSMAIAPSRMDARVRAVRAIVSMLLVDVLFGLRQAVPLVAAPSIWIFVLAAANVTFVATVFVLVRGSQT